MSQARQRSWSRSLRAPSIMVASSLGRPALDESSELVRELLQRLGWSTGARHGALADASRAWARSKDGIGEVIEQLAVIEGDLSRLEGYDEAQVIAAVDVVREVATTEILSQREHESRTDPLTGALNRRALDEALRASLSSAERSGAQLCVMMIDLDGLKKLNDTVGHKSGDLALCNLVEALRSSTRAQDSVYRIGGDEFVALLPFTSPEVAPVIASRVAVLGAPAFSWGAAGYPHDGSDPRTILASADQDLYLRRSAAKAGTLAASS
ncbi:MAG: GGDEF domain-containing protein [Acidimicrobiales bacterium]|nr:GGDEF domain-containing protein [Actinomycetota bacterium]MDA8183780.1 GGDEF domain-containing protein [Actinomycetota bacterium]